MDGENKSSGNKKADLNVSDPLNLIIGCN